MKRLASLFLCSILTVSLVAGCGSKETNKPQEPSTGDKLTTEDKNSSGEKPEAASFTMYSFGTPPSYEIKNTRLGKKILDNVNVSLEIEHLVDDEATKEGIMIASGDLPDIVTSRDVSKFIDAGVVIPLNDLIDEYGPNIKEKYGDDLKYLTSSDGNIYHLSPSRALAPWSKKPLKAMYIQQAVLAEFDYPEIKTIDQYFDILKKYQDKYPQINGQKTVAFTMLADDWRFGIGVLGPVKFLNGYQDDGGLLIDKVGDEYKSRVLYASDEAKEYFKRINQLYLEGYLDETCFTSNYDQYSEKIAQGRVLGFHDQFWEIETPEASMLAAGHVDRVYVGLPIVMEEGIQEKYISRDLVEATKGMMISKNCKDPARVVKFWNDLLSDENQKLIYWGEEGIDYSVDADGKFFWNDEQKEKMTDADYLLSIGIKALAQPFPSTSNDQKYADGNYAWPSGSPEFNVAQYTEQDKKVCEAYGWDTLYDTFKVEPPAPYGYAWTMNPTANGNDAAAYAHAAAEDIMRSYIPKVAFASKDQFDSIWTEYTDKMGTVDLKTYTDFIDAKVIERIEAQNPTLQ